MSKHVTVEQCLGLIQADSAWRKKEISAIKHRIEITEGESEGGAILMRAGIVMLYAHWEGFVKFAATTYILHINERILRFDTPLVPHYRDLLMWRSVQRRGDFPHSRTPLGFLDAMQFWKTEPEKKLSEDMIDAESNLSSKVLQKILRIIDIPSNDFDSKKNLIDKKLLGRRNPIAHGEKRSVTRAEYYEADKEVRELLDIFQKKIEDCVQFSYFMVRDPQN